MKHLLPLILALLGTAHAQTWAEFGSYSVVRHPNNNRKGQHG